MCHVREQRPDLPAPVSMQDNKPDITVFQIITTWIERLWDLLHIHERGIPVTAG